jgi:hypothetical protein
VYILVPLCRYVYTGYGCEYLKNKLYMKGGYCFALGNIICSICADRDNYTRSCIGVVCGSGTDNGIYITLYN